MMKLLTWKRIKKLAPSWWSLFAITVIIVLFVLGLFALLKPTLPGRWCEDEAVWRVCYREWLGALAGWAAIVAAAIALAATRQQIRQDRFIADRQHRQAMRTIRQDRFIADRQHQQAMRTAHASLMDRLDILITRIQRMIDNVQRGQMMLAPVANVRDELLMDDHELGRLEEIKAFKTLRGKIAIELNKPWRRSRRPIDLTEDQKRLLTLLYHIWGRLNAGQEIDQIAREIDT